MIAKRVIYLEYEKHFNSTNYIFERIFPACMQYRERDDAQKRYMTTTRKQRLWIDQLHSCWLHANKIERTVECVECEQAIWLNLARYCWRSQNIAGLHKQSCRKSAYISAAAQTRFLVPDTLRTVQLNAFFRWLWPRILAGAPNVTHTHMIAVIANVAL